MKPKNILAIILGFLAFTLLNYTTTSIAWQREEDEQVSQPEKISWDDLGLGLSSTSKTGEKTIESSGLETPKEEVSSLATTTYISPQKQTLDVNEAPRAKARGLLERNTERPFFILALKGKVFWPRMYKTTPETGSVSTASAMSSSGVVKSATL